MFLVYTEEEYGGFLEVEFLGSLEPKFISLRSEASR